MVRYSARHFAQRPELWTFQDPRESAATAVTVAAEAAMVADRVATTVVDRKAADKAATTAADRKVVVRAATIVAVKAATADKAVRADITAADRKAAEDRRTHRVRIVRVPHKTLILHRKEAAVNDIAKKS